MDRRPSTTGFRSRRFSSLITRGLRPRCLGATGAVALFTVLGGAACGDASATKTHGRNVGAHARRVTEAEYTDVWPFGPNEGILRCRTRNGARLITFEAGGVTYALNPAALQGGFAEIRPIVLTDHAGLPYDYSPVLRLGRALCRR